MNSNDQNPENETPTISQTNEENDANLKQTNSANFILIDIAKCNFLLPFKPASSIFPLEQIITEFFRKKAGRKLTFQFKLFNALSLTLFYPDLYPYFGVQWISPNIFKVNKQIWSNVVSVKAVNGSLFNRQGAFPTHGFEQLKLEEIKENVIPGSLEGVDDDNVRIFRHKGKLFHIQSSINDLLNCSYQELLENETEGIKIVY
ncbi:hypothetical protein TRFO_07143 [Tritrichomonas foetus]|uniref:Initiator binding domain-containing protein n=1 Tax=Tritrichomonas foetus TaxID=1144522 RepID=A0A1J4JYH8_9EUKA|nr:hypothetical protein TRFO_07143 [Tritrichomonas foetus]|eukprot:OHT02325.1 hypothetical protein TRFO_07143 [Tritrichomonas foetus]